MAYRRGERGSVLMVTLAFFTLVFLMAGGWLSSWLVHERTLTLQQEHMQSVYLLDSGVLWAVAQLAADSEWPGGDMETPAGRIQVQVTRAEEGHRELAVYGQTPGSSAAAQVWLDSDGQLLWWHEVGQVVE